MKANRVSAGSEVPTLTKADDPRTAGGKVENAEFSVPGDNGGACMDGDDSTARKCVRDTR